MVDQAVDRRLILDRTLPVGRTSQLPALRADVRGCLPEPVRRMANVDTDAIADELRQTVSTDAADPAATFLWSGVRIAVQLGGATPILAVNDRQLPVERTCVDSLTALAATTPGSRLPGPLPADLYEFLVANGILPTAAPFAWLRPALPPHRPEPDAEPAAFLG